MAINLRQGRPKTTPVWGSGTGAPSTGGGAGTAGPGGRESSTGWVNVQDYLSANADQAKQMGDSFAGQLENEAQTQAKVAEQYRQQLNDFTTGATNQTTNPAWTEWEKNRAAAQAGAAKAYGGGGAYQTWLSQNPEPNKLVGTPKVDKEPTLPGGPNATLEKIKAAATPAGMTQHFADIAGPSYTTGQGNLDSYLASASGAGKTIGALAQKYGTVLDLIRSPYPGAPGPTTSGAPRPDPIGGRSPGGTYAEPGYGGSGQPVGTGIVPPAPQAMPGGTTATPIDKRKKRFA